MNQIFHNIVVDACSKTAVDEVISVLKEQKWLFLQSIMKLPEKKIGVRPVPGYPAVPEPASAFRELVLDLLKTWVELITREHQILDQYQDGV